MKNQILTENEQLARNVLGMESEANFRIGLTDDNQLLENQLKNQAKSKLSDSIDEYVDKLDKHQELLDTYMEKFKDTMQDLEIMPLYRYSLIKVCDVNPFQQLHRQGTIITDTYSELTHFKNSDTGEWEQEESYIGVGLVIEVGPECKYLKEGDMVMFKKESAFPVPFYNQGFSILDEQRVSVVINENLHKRLKNKE